ncbi:hypothetical protein Tco_0531258 [Tanacetum coccineum]
MRALVNHNLFPEGTTINPKDSVGNKQPIDTRLPSTSSNEGTTKTTPRFEGRLRDKDSWGNKTPADMEPINLTITDPSGTGAKYQVDQTQSTRLRYQSLTKNEGEPLYEGEPDAQPLVLSTYADVRAFLLSNDEASENEEDILGAGEAVDEDSQTVVVSTMLFNRITKDHWEKHEESAVHYANLKASINDYYDENIAHRDQADKLVEASMSSRDKSNTTISDLYKGINIITGLLKEINNVVKDDPAMNKKINKGT